MNIKHSNDINFKLFFLLGITFSILSCDDLYKPEDIISDGLENMKFECFDSTSNFYFKGKFGEDSISEYDGDNGYLAYLGQGFGFVTLTRTYTYEDLLSQKSKTWVVSSIQQRIPTNTGGVFDFEEEISVLAQPCKFGTPLDSMVRAFITNGTHPVRGLMDNDSVSTEGFEIMLTKHYINPSLNPDHWNIICSSALGKQTSDSYVNVLDVSLTQNGDYIEGYLHLTFKCKTFNDNAGKLTGSFVRDFSGEFNLPIRYKL